MKICYHAGEEYPSSSGGQATNRIGLHLWNSRQIASPVSDLREKVSLHAPTVCPRFCLVYRLPCLCLEREGPPGHLSASLAANDRSSACPGDRHPEEASAL